MHHMLLMDVDLPHVVKMLSKNLSQFVTYNLFNDKSDMTGIRLEKLSFANAGYYFFSPVNNMGNIFWLLLFFHVLLTVFIAYGVYMLVLYICSGSRPRRSKRSKYRARVLCNIFDSMRSLFATNQIVSIVCVMLYFKHETTYFSTNIVSGT